MNSNISADAKKYLPPPDLISEYYLGVLRFNRTNYEILVALWGERLITKIMPKYNVPIVNSCANHLTNNNGLIGLEISIDQSYFTFVTRFTSMVHILVHNIPTGLGEED